MSGEILAFPENKKHTSQAQIDKALADDPRYKFIHDLLTAMVDVGLPLDGTPSAKARELYAKYQRDTTFVQWSVAANKPDKTD